VRLTIFSSGAKRENKSLYISFILSGDYGIFVRAVNTAGLIAIGSFAVGLQPTDQRCLSSYWDFSPCTFQVHTLVSSDQFHQNILHHFSSNAYRSPARTSSPSMKFSMLAPTNIFPLLWIICSNSYSG